MKLTSRGIGALGFIGLFWALPGMVSAEEVVSAAAPVVVDTVAAVAAAEKSATHALLLRAIRERRLLHFNYSGHARVVEPHAYGVSATGEVVLHSFQTSGGSLSQPPPGWRTFVVANISDLVVTETDFAGPRSDYVTDGQLKLAPLWAELGATAKTD